MILLQVTQDKVLILVLMEDTLRAVSLSLDKPVRGVLILVLMEDTLRDSKIKDNARVFKS